MRTARWLLPATMMLVAVPALAQESEFQKKIQEDMNDRIDDVQSACKITVKMRWSGKLGFNPRESEKPKWNAVSTLTTSGIMAVEDACRSNAAVKKAVSKVKTIEAKKGKGTISYKLAGAKLILTVDPSYTKNNPAGQQNDLMNKLVKDLDK
jgi:hypothetical protein